MTMKQHRLGDLFGNREHCINCGAARLVTAFGNPKGPWKMPDGTRAPWCQGKAPEQKA